MATPDGMAVTDNQDGYYMGEYIKLFKEVIAMASKLEKWRYIAILVTVAAVVFIWKLPELVKAISGA